MTQLLVLLVPMALKLIEVFIEKSKDNTKLRKQYIEFLENLHADEGNPVKAKKSIDLQKIKLREMYLKK